MRSLQYNIVSRSFQSLLVAVLLCQPLSRVCFGTESTLSSIVRLVLFALVGGCTVFYFVKNVGKRNVSVAYAAAVYAIVLYAATSLVAEWPSISVFTLIGGTLLPLIVPQVMSVDVRLTIKAVMLSALLVISLGGQSLAIEADYELDWLIISHALMVPIIASMVYLCLFASEEKGWRRWLTIIGTVANAVLLLLLIMKGARAPLLAIFMLAAVFLCIRYDRGRFRIRWILFTVMLVVCFFSILFFPDIITFVAEILHRGGLELQLIDKYANKIAQGDITSGRAEIWAIAWHGFLQHPMLGNGISQIEYNAGIVHPHNFLLQMLYDGGLVLALGILIPVCTLLRRTIRNRDGAAMLTMLLFCSVPTGLLSKDLWGNTALWLFFGYAMSRGFSDMPSTQQRQGKHLFEDCKIHGFIGCSAVALLIIVVFCLGFTRTYHSRTPRHMNADTPLVVVCLGQHARYDHFTLNGYDRPTTPFLENLDNLMCFCQVYCKTGGSHKSTDAIVASIMMEEYNARMAYLSSRSVSLKGLSVMMHANYRYLSLPILPHDDFYDASMMPRIEDAYESGCRRIIVAGNGSVRRYCMRYPAECEFFRPSFHPCESFLKSNGIMKDRLINSYDNSIRYTDLCLARLINWTNNLAIPAVVIYLSAQGEALPDDCSDDAQLHVPMFVWYSDAFAFEYADRIERLKSLLDSNIRTEEIGELLRIIE